MSVTKCCDQDYRDVIRTSWGSPTIPGVKTRVAFMLGYPYLKIYQEQIEKENLLHGDIVQGNFLDSYKNLTYKTVMGHMWVSSFCTQAEFLMKADDDIYLDIYGLYTVARRYIEDKVNLKLKIVRRTTGAKDFYFLENY